MHRGARTRSHATPRALVARARAHDAPKQVPPSSASGSGSAPARQPLAAARRASEPRALPHDSTRSRPPRASAPSTHTRGTPHCPPRPRRLRSSGQNVPGRLCPRLRRRLRSTAAERRRPSTTHVGPRTTTRVNSMLACDPLRSSRRWLRRHLTRLDLAVVARAARAAAAALGRLVGVLFAHRVASPSRL